MYFTGQIAPLDAREGMRWYRKAAEQGLSDAQFNSGLMYVEGHSTLQDFVRAHMWLNIAAATSSGDDLGEAVMLRGFAASQMTAAQIRAGDGTALSAVSVQGVRLGGQGSHKNLNTRQEAHPYPQSTLASSFATPLKYAVLCLDR